MLDVSTIPTDFDVRSILGETESDIDWNKVQQDFQSPDSQSQFSIRSLSRRRLSALYPVFEIPVWELDATWHLLDALDAHCEVQERKLTVAGEAHSKILQQLQAAEVELSMARTQFLAAFQMLARTQEITTSSYESQSMRALNALGDLEMAWQSQT